MSTSIPGMMLGGALVHGFGRAEIGPFELLGPPELRLAQRLPRLGSLELRDGLLEPIAPQLLLPGVAPANFRGGTLKWMDTSSQYLLQGAEYVFGWLLVNKDKVDPSSIKSWRDLLDPKYCGKIV